MEYLWNIWMPEGWCYTTLSCMCPLPYSMCISRLLLCNKSLQNLETYNKHLLLLTGLQVSWAVLLTWAWFGRSWCGSHMHLWAAGRLAEGCRAQGGLPQKSDSCFTINKGDSGTEPCVSFSWQCSLIMRSEKKSRTGQSLLRLRLRISWHTITHAVFCWSKWVTRPAQI